VCEYRAGGDGGRSLSRFGEALRMWPLSGRIMPASLRVGERGPESPWTAGREAVANAMVGILVSYISLQLQQGMSGGVEEW
jgi:hypothetical protein